MGNSTSVEPAPPPEQLGFGTMLFYLWLFYCAIKIVNNASDGKLSKKKKKDKNENDPLKKSNRVRKCKRRN